MHGGLTMVGPRMHKITTVHSLVSSPPNLHKIDGSRGLEVTQSLATFMDIAAQALTHTHSLYSFVLWHSLATHTHTHTHTCTQASSDLLYSEGSGV